ncbi:Heat shock protein. Metallo peptidase. MEROPS family M48B [Rhizobiales bacterium GAS191]|jgi:heat shock protein HtpX|nr:Heat shock protein. Metallo peptidase. MEROPS family M48B [Rhizobiales bacterium GAS113]SEC02274.1 Heat shock protein. Metallo peptidase. MEROPS family M48B [Rhizobiales bacterium GAS191]SED16796.1 Heat shock protein. Metallo peptidase. MEROPS family M48B [Rhizobiales bacterium GAS188]
MFQSFGLYTHIRANKIKSVVILCGFVVLILVMTYALNLVAIAFSSSGGYLTGTEIMNLASRNMREDWVYAVAFSLAWFAIAFVLQSTLIDASTGATLPGPAEQRRVFRLLEPLCISVGMPTPKIKVMETDSLNAFASGLNQNDASITVTTGLLAKLNDRELTAVLGHELTHIKNQDVRLIVIAAIFAGILSFVGQMTVRVLLNMGGGRSDDRKGGAGIAIIIAIALAALSWFLAILLKLALSRRREYLADAGSVELTKDPDAMISALKRIEDHAEIDHVPSLVQEAFIENPSTGFSGMFDTHPPIEARIDALVKYAGGNADAVVDDPMRQVRAPAGPAAPIPPAAPSPGPWNPMPQPDQASTAAPGSSPTPGSFIPTPGQPLPWGPRGGPRGKGS